MTTTPDHSAAPDLGDWRAFVDAMEQLKHVAPWKTLHESMCVGVANPEQPDEIAYCSVLGGAHEHYGISAFIGAVGFANYMDMAAGRLSSDASLTDLDCIMLSFDDRDEVEDYMRAVHQQLQRRYKGRSSWPNIRRLRPGSFAVEPSRADLRFARHIVEQVCAVTQQVRDGQIAVPRFTSRALLVRVSAPTPDGLVWSNDLRCPPGAPTPPALAPVPPDPALVQEVRQKCQPVNTTWECACRIVPVIIEQPGFGQLFPYLVVCAEQVSSRTMPCAQVFQQTPGLDHLPAAFLTMLITCQKIPRTVLFTQQHLITVLTPALNALGITARLVPAVRDAEHALNYLSHMLQQGPPRS